MKYICITFLLFISCSRFDNIKEAKQKIKNIDGYIKIIKVDEILKRENSSDFLLFMIRMRSLSNIPVAHIVVDLKIKHEGSVLIHIRKAIKETKIKGQSIKSFSVWGDILEPNKEIVRRVTIFLDYHDNLRKLLQKSNLLQRQMLGKSILNRSFQLTITIHSALKYTNLKFS